MSSTPDAAQGVEPSRHPLVSIIIPAYNAAATLPLCLSAVRESDYPRTEAIVVSDASADDSAQVAQSFGVRTIVNERQQGAAYARNVGAVAARGDIFFFVDADCILAPDAVSIAVTALTSGEQVVFGSYIADTRAPGFFSQFKNLQHHFTHQQGEDVQSSFWSGCGAITRAAFEDIEGFDVSLQACEDIEFGYALTRRGYQVRLLKSMQAEHLKRYDLPKLLKSDLFGRAIPWTRLVAAGRSELGKLNTRPGGKRSVALTGISWLALASSWAFPSLAAAVVALSWSGVFLLNRELLGFIRRRRGWLFAAGSAMTLLAHFSVAGLGFILGHLARRYPAERTPAPQYAWAEQPPGPKQAAAAAVRPS
jgi:GT2 family glycosyltransferase